VRIRTIKPSFWKSLSIASLPMEVRFFFVGLWNYADDAGRGIDFVRRIAAGDGRAHARGAGRGAARGARLRRAG
jgi:hypothetical protein